MSLIMRRTNLTSLEHHRGAKTQQMHKLLKIRNHLQQLKNRTPSFLQERFANFTKPVINNFHKSTNVFMQINMFCFKHIY